MVPVDGSVFSCHDIPLLVILKKFLCLFIGLLIDNRRKKILMSNLFLCWYETLSLVYF